ncbi:hypothetical protein ACHAWU_001806 [Discostella pseudostelligera]|uniref:Uncharacterized protein n=1 Tax=Discostella pseudostelligera TaxID=259834 RepID=A0ABD3MFT2_9STRA
MMLESLKAMPSTMPTPSHSQPFRKCHLHVLRSLYASQDESNAHDRRHRASSPSSNEYGVERTGTDDNALTKEDIASEVATEDNSDQNEAEHNVYDTEIPVRTEIWSHIERFLHLRAQYRPHKERQLHWSKVYAESNSRLDSILSTACSTSKQDGHNVPLTSKSSLTPRTPLFGTTGRSGSLTPSHSLTPVSSNRHNNATKTRGVNYDNRGGGELVTTLPAWNFINQMLHRHTRQSMQSCTLFRSQPCLTILQEEAEKRCNLLQKMLKRRSSMQRLQQPAGKRRKLEKAAEFERTTNSTIASSSLGNFILSKYSNAGLGIEFGAEEDEDFLTCAQMKFHLWTILLSSVRWETSY